MHRTFVRDLDQPHALRIVEIPGNGQFTTDLIDFPLARLAFGAIGCMNLLVRQTNRDVIERPFLAVGIKPERHR
ncbi:MAG: hypothetical protein WEC00_10320, partial [Dongiaceae bacterium]